MYRSCSRTLGLLLLMAPFLGCSHSPTPVTAGDQYTLRLVFDGLITVAREQEGEPSQAWILVGNASEPEKLLVGKKIPPHMSHLFVRVQDEDRNVEAQVSGRVLSPPAPQPDLPGFWQGTMLTGEDLRLEANTSTQFELPFDKFRRKQPCNPKNWFLFCWEKRSIRQRENLGWTVDLDDALAELPGEAYDKKVKSCLTEEPYSCQGSPLLLNARLKLDSAHVFVNQLFGERAGTPGGKLPRSVLRIAGRPVSRVRAQAEEIAAELVVSGPVKIISTLLDGSGAMDTLQIQGQPGKTVEVRLVNHPEVCTSLQECQAMGFTDNDFLFNFNLLNKPDFVGVCQLPVPIQVPPPPPAFNTQCSPSSYRP